VTEMRLDAHQHFWRYDPDEYAWIDDTMEAIKSDFLPEHLAQEIKGAEIDGSIAVQARQTVEETAWLLELAQENDFIHGVVGWIPLTSLKCGKYLELYSLNPFFKGVRHVIQDEPDDEFILREDFNQGISQLKEYELVYEILVYEHQLPQTIRFVDRHPHQIFVLDHIGKPRIQEGLHPPWRKHIQLLAERDHVFCKLSGMVTEAGYDDWTAEQLTPYYEIVVEAFWPERIMFGSDWPVCLVAAEYQTWAGVVETWSAALSEHERQRILGETASEVYKIAGS